jgi:hypothetical protein
MIKILYIVLVILDIKIDKLVAFFFNVFVYVYVFEYYEFIC